MALRKQLSNGTDQCHLQMQTIVRDMSKSLTFHSLDPGDCPNTQESLIYPCMKSKQALIAIATTSLRCPIYILRVQNSYYKIVLNS